ncbi:hypothetical protein GQ44DRAFT_625099 [Phaeosphaeriaceae sp. PMI808]|nr:hypothetical protein GQ44DRAFT_625099 [Phaeosphaeriaceae sp. PMI808]
MQDPTDLIAQSLIQALFDTQPKVQLEEYALQASRTSKLIWPALVEEWVSSRVQSTRTPPLKDFVGTYLNTGFLLKIEIFPLTEKSLDVRCESRSNPELLEFRVSSQEKQAGPLRHYHYDVWTFLPDSRDDCVRRGMEDFVLLPMLLLSFNRNAEGMVNGLDWDLQASVCEGPAPGLDWAVAPIRFIRI